MLLSSMIMPVYANPTGGQITAGTGSIAQTGNTMNITQNTNKMSINWQSFNIAKNETVNFQQPGTSAIALNRVVGNNASSIYGHLNANGQVFLINTNGVLFAPGSAVNVGGLVASTLNISDRDFQNGNYKFSGTGGSVVNQGTLTATDGGYVALLGNQVANQGVVMANQGTVALGAGNTATLDFNGDGLYSLAVTEAALNAQASNQNLIQANGGQVYMTARAANVLAGSVLNNSGVIEAQSIVNKNGVIVLDGGPSGAVVNSGTLDASGRSAGQTGGTVKVLGDNLTLATGTNIDVSGANGGGTALIGGNVHGQGSEQNATTTTVAKGATIDADAITSGNGGKVVVWANDTTSFDGTINAKGGSVSGDGGSVETSGKKLMVGDDAMVTTLAAHGSTGNWLLDPDGFTIAASGGDITGAKLSSELASNSITIKSTDGSGLDGNVNVNDAVTWSADTTLELDATNSINVDAAVTATGTGAGLTLNAAKGDINLDSSMAMASSATMTAAKDVNIYAPLTWSAGDLTLKAGNNVNNFKNLTWSTGTLKMIAGHDANLNYGLTIPATAPASTAVVLAGGNNININCGLYSFTPPLVSWSAGTLTLSAGKNIYINGVTQAFGPANLVANYGYVLDANGNPTATATAGTNSDGTLYGLYCFQVPTQSTYYGTINFNGTGSVTINNQPYTVITTAAQLAEVNNNLSGNYVLGTAIYGVTMTGTTPNLTAAIGSASTPFTGNFNGLGHSIGATLLATGLFDTIGSSGVISNLGVSANINQPTSGTITTSAVGTLANNNQGTIINSYGAGGINYNTATGNGAFYTGGLVGDNSGLIALSYSNSGTKYAVDIAGGLVGRNETGGTILDCAAVGGITNGASPDITYVGGLVGENDGTIKLSYVIIGTSGPINLKDTSSMTGGLVGLNTGLIDQCYVAGYSTGTNPNLAGFVWKNTGTIDDSYSVMLASKNASAAHNWTAGFVDTNTGTINGAYTTEYVTNTTSTPQSGFVHANTGTITNAYWYANVADGATAPTDTTTAVSLNAAQAATFANYAGFNSRAWSASTSGYPILGNIPVCISGSSFGIYYGQATSDPVSLGLTAWNTLQGGGGFGSVDDITKDVYDAATNTVTNQFQAITDNGYVDAGDQAASLILTSSVYKNIYGEVIVTPLPLAVDGTIADKPYDGTTAATLNTSGVANCGLVGAVGNQTLGITWSDPVFSNVNAGSQTITITYSNLSGGANGGHASNYTIANTTTTAGVTKTTTTATISPKLLTAGFTVADKVYDGTTAVNVTYNGTLTGIVGTDTVSLDTSGYTAAFADANAGSGKTVTISGLFLTGASSSNYTIGDATTTATISPRVLSLGGVVDSSTSTTVSGSNLSATNVVSGDTVTFGGTAAIAATAADTKPITSVSGLTVSNANYTLTGSSGNVIVSSASRVLDPGNPASGLSDTSTATSNGITTTTYTTNADKSIIDWLRFNIPANEAVVFTQPNLYSLVLNRVTTGLPSTIAGQLTSNGRVFLINPNGILFSSGTSVNVGAIVAGTLNLSDNNFLSGNYALTNTGVRGAVTVDPDASITAQNDGFVVLASNGGVTSSGILSTPGGKILLVAADDLTLVPDSAGCGLNGYAISGLDGTTTVGGVVNVAATSGNGGLLETAGNTVTTTSDFQLGTGNNGTWSWSLPTITIGSGGNFTPSLVQNSLVLRNLSLNALDGDLTVNDPVKWSADTWLTLSAKNNININNAITINGANAGLVMNYGGYNGTTVTTPAAGTNYFIRTPASYSGAVLDANGNPVARTDTSGGVYGSITFTNSANTNGLTINGQNYTLIHNLGQLDMLDGWDATSGTSVYPKAATIPSSIGSVSASGNDAYYYFYNDATGCYDLPASKVVNGKLYYYDPATKAYDLTAANDKYYYNPATGAYDIPMTQNQVVDGNGTTYYYDPATGKYDINRNNGGSIYSGYTDTIAYNPVFYYNMATNLYDIPQIKVINGTKYYYNFATKSYDLTAPYSGPTQFYYNPATRYYDIPQTQVIDGTTYYYDPANGQYDLRGRSSSIPDSYYYNPSQGVYSIPSTQVADGTTQYYNPTTGSYQTDYLYYSTPYYYNPGDGLFDLTYPYTITGNYAFAKSLDASGSSYGTALIQSFSGNFTGLGHTISNLSLDTQYKSMNWTIRGSIALSVFGTATSSTIRDVGIVDVGIHWAALPGYYLVSGSSLAGNITDSTVSNAYATGALYSGGSGLIGGATDSTITDCYTNMNLYAGGGGLAGSTTGGSVTYSDATGSIMGGGGGLISTATNTYLANDYATGAYALAGTAIKDTVTGDATTGYVTSFADYDLGGAEATTVGGLVGTYNGYDGADDTIVNCFAIENIAGWTQLGGLVAYANVSGDGSALTITNCYWKGDMHARGNQTCIYTAIGGLVGYAGNRGNSYTGTINIVGSHTSGSIEVDGPSSQSNTYGMPQVGGLVGYISADKIPLNIQDSYSATDIYAPNTSLVGGLMGWGLVNISHSYATGNIVGYNSVGGLIGGAGSSTGTVNGVPYFYGSSISDSYFSGTATATSTSANTMVGGLAGSWNRLSTMTNSYWNTDNNAAPAGGGLSQTNYQGKGNEGITGADFANGDISHYLDGTIGEVRAARIAAVAARQEAAETATQQSAATQQTVEPAGSGPQTDMGRQSRQTMGDSMQNLLELLNPTNLFQSTVDDRLVHSELGSYSAHIKSIFANGVEYQVEDNDASDEDNGAK